jgi:hypothetical protein
MPICNYCQETKYSKHAFDKHVLFCKYIRHTTKKERDEQETVLPSQQVMFQMLLDMNAKYRELEKKMERILVNQHNQTRRTILQHLKSTPQLSMTFSKWISTMYVNSDHLQIFFDKDITDSIAKVVTETLSVGTLEEIPMRNYAQKPNQIYIYDYVVGDCKNIFEWRLMETEDWKRMMFSHIAKRIKEMYFEWKRENQEYIDNDETMFELNYKYMLKVKNISEMNVETKIKKIKEIIIKMIQTTLVVID